VSLAGVIHRAGDARGERGRELTGGGGVERLGSGPVSRDRRPRVGEGTL
jgi:hypothetical protein